MTRVILCLFNLLALLLTLGVSDADESCSCGWSNAIQPRIVGGAEARVYEFPMIAAIVDVRTKFIVCNGAIISNRHILTAANCLSETLRVGHGVLVGAHDLTVDTNVTKLYRLGRLDIHPLYNESLSTAYDIGIVTIDGRIRFSEEVGPACLPFNHARDNFEGVEVDVPGWGVTDPEATDARISDTLQKTTMRVVSADRCRPFNRLINTDVEMCLYSEGRHPCFYDSGGPVIWPSIRSMVLVGIISEGRNCDSKPTSYTRVSAHLNWIQQVTPGVQYCVAD